MDKKVSSLEYIGEDSLKVFESIMSLRKRQDLVIYDNSRSTIIKPDTLTDKVIKNCIQYLTGGYDAIVLLYLGDKDLAWLKFAKKLGLIGKEEKNQFIADSLIVCNVKCVSLESKEGQLLKSLLNKNEQ